MLFNEIWASCTCDIIVCTNSSTESGNLIRHQGPMQSEAGKELGSLDTPRLAL